MSKDDEPTDLVPTSGTAIDAYEREYMGAEGKVLARHRMVAGPKFNVFLALLTGLITAPMLIGGQFLAGAITLATMALMWVLMGVLRVSVSERTVNIQYMMIGPTIPIESIVSAEAITYSPLRSGGWGIRWRGDGWIYNMMGDEGKAVKIVWTKAKGKEVVSYVGLKTAEALAADIRRAMQGAGTRELLGAEAPRQLGSSD